MSSHDGNFYRYTPSLPMAVIFLVVFSISLAAHTVQAFLRRSPRWMLCMSVGCLMEVIGWAFRLWGHFNTGFSGWIGQQVVLVIGPTFYSATLYVLLGSIIGEIAPHNSSLSANAFKIIFITADIITIALQGAGGGMAGSAETDAGVATGSNIMLAGIVAQLVVMVIYSVYGAVWIAKSRKALDDKTKMLLYGMIISSLAIEVRGVYRTAELAQGFHGALADNQMTFLLDAIPSSIATIALNVFHPAQYLTVSLKEETSATSSLSEKPLNKWYSIGRKTPPSTESVAV
ncbi:hypothetical protein MNV49_004925 [Pseudohyphozyma bogoriensis]|nr:hypothetical protein MNV49_004925 [Pseudohyphozyma bogoriensis]